MIGWLVIKAKRLLLLLPFTFLLLPWKIYGRGRLSLQCGLWKSVSFWMNSQE